MLLPPHQAVVDSDATRSSLSRTIHDLTTITSGDIPESFMPQPTTAVTVATVAMVAMVATVATVAMAAMAKAMVAMVATVTAMVAMVAVMAAMVATVAMAAITTEHLLSSILSIFDRYESICILDRVNSFVHCLQLLLTKSVY